DGKQIDTLYPGRSIFRKHENEEPRSDLAIRRTLAEDLYLVLPQVDFSTQTITLQVVINPLVDWIWIGFGVLAVGTMIALLPERACSFAVAKVRAEAATGGAAILLALLLATAPLRAQHVEDPAGISPPVNDVERQLRNEMGCTCGTCAHEPLTKCTCGTASQMRAELRDQVSKGKNRDEIIAHFMSVYGGQQFLASPIDKGFNRLAWLVPYSLAGTGVFAIGLAAYRWSRRRRDEESAGGQPPVVDAALDQRLDDELR